MAILDALKNLAVALGCCADVSDVTGDTIAEAIQFIADNWTPAEVNQE